MSTVRAVLEANAGLTSSLLVVAGKHTLLAHIQRAHENTGAGLADADLVPSMFSAPATRDQLQQFAAVNADTIKAAVADAALPPPAPGPVATPSAVKPSIKPSIKPAVKAEGKSAPVPMLAPVVKAEAATPAVKSKVEAASPPARVPASSPAMPQLAVWGDDGPRKRARREPSQRQRALGLVA